jgi:hypothetical protein
VILKAQLHTHTKQDPLEKISYSEFELIDKAAYLGYQILSITCNGVVIFNEQIAAYAKEKNILLIPGIEKTISKQQIIILNANLQSQDLKNFDDLREYKKQNPKTLIILSKPSHWQTNKDKLELIQNFDLIDSIEDQFSCNEKIQNAYTQIATEKNLPTIAASNTKILKYLDQAYTLINSQKLDIESIFQAIKSNKIQKVSTAISHRDFLGLKITIGMKNFLKKALLLS